MFEYYGDESADVGFSKKSSKYFVYGFVKVKLTDKDKIRKEMKNIMRGLIKERKKRLNYFHASSEKDGVRNKLLKIFRKYEIGVVLFVYFKNSPLEYKNILADIINKMNTDKVNKFFLSRYDTRRNVNDFIVNTLVNKIEIKETQKDFLLQLADFVAWACFQKYEKNFPDFLEKIKNLCNVTESYSKTKPLGLE